MKDRLGEENANPREVRTTIYDFHPNEGRSMKTNIESDEGVIVAMELSSEPTTRPFLSSVRRTNR